MSNKIFRSELLPIYVLQLASRLTEGIFIHLHASLVNKGMHSPGVKLKKNPTYKTKKTILKQWVAIVGKNEAFHHISPFQYFFSLFNGLHEFSI